MNNEQIHEIINLFILHKYKIDLLEYILKVNIDFDYHSYTFSSFLLYINGKDTHPLTLIISNKIIEIYKSIFDNTSSEDLLILAEILCDDVYVSSFNYVVKDGKRVPSSTAKFSINQHHDRTRQPINYNNKFKVIAKLKQYHFILALDER